ncbi:hypothetical protein BOSEA31B_11348 [Hyphomicrobiales bacterium]|nr:hypothetical protein BOSEA31B_11348 [Hyphomicrobiales bacterium]CAH1697140.1 hypothetical protein BOSEA1005_10177 [Hyphomicrobiales bacterium]CAI0342708.1 hypothetical protein BO1005MUT1_10001 [Hyphomicrobiales bacterium]
MPTIAALRRCRMLVDTVAVYGKDLGGVDGFDQDEGCCDGDYGCEVSLGLLASQGDALKALELADGLLDTGAPAIEGFREEAGLVLLVRC